MSTKILLPFPNHTNRCLRIDTHLRHCWHKTSEYLGDNFVFNSESCKGATRFGIHRGVVHIYFCPPNEGYYTHWVAVDVRDDRFEISKGEGAAIPLNLFEDSPF